MKFRKKPVVIEATCHHGKESVGYLYEWTEGYCFVDDDNELAIRTLEGTMKVSVGDWVIRGVQGEYYPCKPDIFAATYEPVE